MPSVTIVGRKPSPAKPPKAERLPPIAVGSTLTKKLDKAIVNAGALREKQLKFTSRLGFVSPSGNPLQVVYLTPAASKTGLDITYVDARAKQFWAQAPGVSGLARGPFKLPAGVDRELAKVTSRELKAKDPKPPKSTGGSDFVFHDTGSDDARIRRALSGSTGTWSYGGGGVGWGS